MKKIILLTLLLTYLHSSGQENTKSFSLYSSVYPISENPNISYKSSISDLETLLFEANPIVRLSFFNNFLRELPRNVTNHTQAWYISFRPQIRMYTDNSLPVKTPSYRIFLATQQLWRVKYKDLVGFSLESGHYSNGQSGGAFSEQFEDGSPESEAIYNTINETTDLSRMLNRRDGNFSTNLTELIFNYRKNKLDDINDAPYRIHSFKIGGTLYHDRFLGLANFGGYSDNDIKIYGRFRSLYGYEFTNVFKRGKGMRISFAENIEIIHEAHKSVEPLRAGSIFTIYPFMKVSDLGIFTSVTIGHDNYNYRFVDSGTEVSIGITWDVFPPFSVRGLALP